MIIIDRIIISFCTSREFKVWMAQATVCLDGNDDVDN